MSNLPSLVDENAYADGPRQPAILRNGGVVLRREDWAASITSILWSRQWQTDIPTLLKVKQARIESSEHLREKRHGKLSRELVTLDANQLRVRSSSELTHWHIKEHHTKVLFRFIVNE